MGMMRVFCVGALAVALSFSMACGKRGEKSGDSGSGHRARVVLEVNPPADEADAGMFVETQAQLATTRVVLVAAAQDLDLAERWGEPDLDGAVAKLEPMVKSARIGESKLIELVVEQPDADEATEIANAMARAFVDLLVRAEQQRSEARLERLQSDLDEQRTKLEESRQKMLDIMEKNGVIDIGLMPVGGQDDSDEAKAKELARLRASLGALDSLEGDDRIRAAIELGILRDSKAAGESFSRLQNIQLARHQLEDSGVGTQHPKVVALEAEIEVVRSRLLAQVDASERAVRTRLDVEQVATESLPSRSGALEVLRAREEYELEKAVLRQSRRPDDTTEVPATVVEPAR